MKLRNQLKVVVGVTLAGAAGYMLGVFDDQRRAFMLAAILSTVLLSGWRVTCSFRPTSDAYELGHSVGYDAGYLAGRRAARPVVVPLQQTKWCRTCEEEDDGALRSQAPIG